jgi:hypothetical protein
VITIAAAAAGLVCGYLNLWILTSAGRRLANSGNTKPFVLSSLLRVGAFAIVAGIFAAVGPWPMALYIAGLFVPLALHAAGVLRLR